MASLASHLPRTSALPLNLFLIFTQIKLRSLLSHLKSLKTWKVYLIFLRFSMYYIWNIIIDACCLGFLRGLNIICTWLCMGSRIRKYGLLLFHLFKITAYPVLFLHCSFFFFFYFILFFKLYITVLDLPNIKMNPPLFLFISVISTQLKPFLLSLPRRL